MKPEGKLWGGRFSKTPDAAMNDFHSSIAFDARLAEADIRGSIAHAEMLGQQGIIPLSDAERIHEGLRGLLADLRAGKLAFSSDAEDIHMNIESMLTERIGKAGKRLHTGRSRNDQVALDMRIYMKQGCKDTRRRLLLLIAALLDTAEKHTDTLLSGYTHLQKAQPVTLAHHLLAYVEMFRRDADRLSDCIRRTDVMPLGSGALATSTYPLDRQSVADALQFASISSNSLDAVSDRDFVIEYVFCAGVIMMHLSRFCEELVLWSSDEFRYVEMDDAFSTGSSIMPQKKNPDAAELIRGKTGRVYGDLMALLSMMKSLPLAYNKDMQEDKEAAFDALDTTLACLDIFTKMFQTLSFRAGVMKAGALRGFTNATDAADYLVKKGVPFRIAHEIVGKLVANGISQGKGLEEMTLEELKTFSGAFEADVFDAITLSACVSERSLPGGPAPEATKRHMAEARRWLELAAKSQDSAL